MSDNNIVPDDLEEILRIEKRIDTREEDAADGRREDIRDRWESGREMLRKRVGKQLPKGELDKLAEAIGKGRSEVKYRMQFAEQYPAEDKVAIAVATLDSWRQVKKSLSKPSGRQGNPARDAQIAELKEQGKTRDEIAAAVGIAPRNVDNALRANRAADEARAETEAETTDWSHLPGPQREKLEKAKASITKRMEKEFRTRLLAETDQYRAECDANVVAYKAKLDASAKAERAARDEERERYKLGIAAQRANGLITPSEYMTIIACLHPDNSASTEKRAEAFRLFNDPKVKTLLVKER